MHLEKHLVRFVKYLRYSDLPGDVLQATKRHLLDTIGVSLVGSKARRSEIILDFSRSLGGIPEATIIGHGDNTTTVNATFANSFFATMLDFEDVHEKAVVHPGGVVIPVGLAIGERERIGGKELIESVVAGYDIMIRMALGFKWGTGWFKTSLCGCFGAAATAGKILKLSEQQMANAFGIAYSQAAGNLEYSIPPGSWTKAFQCARAAESGIVACFLAQRGFLGPRSALSGRFGFYELYTREYHREPITRDLGKKFEIGNTALKPYPCCRQLGSPIDAALKIVNRYNVKRTDVKRVIVRVKKRVANTLKPRESRIKPKNVIDAQYSLPFAVACAIAQEHTCVLDWFTGDSIKDKVLLELAKKVEGQVDPELDKTKFSSPCVMTLYLKDGKKHEEVILTSKGSTENPMTDKEILEKFHSCAISVLQKPKIQEVIDMIKRLEMLDDITDLIRKLVPP